MRRSLLAPVALAAASLALAQQPAREREKDETVENAIQYPAPASEMQKISLLLGRWTGTQTWKDPRRYKRGRYEGYPGPDGHVVRSVEPGPGGFSLVWTDEGRGPMGGYTARAVLSWDPERRVYLLDRVHSLFPGIARLTGEFEQGDLVLRGSDPLTGEKPSARLVFGGLSGDGWTETLDAGEPVVTTVFRRSETAP